MLEYSLTYLPLSTIRRYEHPLSALSMAAGFGFDNYYFSRVDHPATQIALLGYVAIAIVSILFVHFIESRGEPRGLLLRAHPFLVVATQFALGGLWSAFLIFYGRSAVIAASWPFLIVLAGMLVGNEVFRKYHARLAFTCTLLFFALFSYAILAVPLLTRTLGQRTFLLSGGVAVFGFCSVLLVLWAIERERMRAAWRGIALGAAGVFAIINLFYFTNILPPLPLTLTKAGIFHSLEKTGETYRAVSEPNDLPATLLGAAGAAPVLHILPGERLYAYSAVFAPIQLRTSIEHIWRRYDETQGWQTESVVRFPLPAGAKGVIAAIPSSPICGQDDGGWISRPQTGASSDVWHFPWCPRPAPLPASFKS